MAYTGPVLRWDIFWTDFEPHVGREQAGDCRPALVISNDKANEIFDVVTVVPLTKLEGKKRQHYLSEVPLPKSCVGNEYTPLAIAFQLRTVSKLRLLQAAGRLEDELAQEKIEGHPGAPGNRVGRRLN